MVSIPFAQGLADVTGSRHRGAGEFGLFQVGMGLLLLRLGSRLLACPDRPSRIRDAWTPLIDRSGCGCL